MSYADLPAATDMERVLTALDELKATLEKHKDAINNLSANVQWVVERAEGLFQMFGSPQFMAGLPAMMGGMTAGMPGETAGEISE